VYVQTTHPWLKKMLALHINDAGKKRFSVTKAFKCKRCGNYFCNPKYNKQQTCKWCALLSKKETVATNCAMCNKVLKVKYRSQKTICKECLEVLDRIKTALKYTYYVLWKAKQYDKHEHIAVNLGENEYD
jgi:hypothetical protein